MCGIAGYMTADLPSFSRHDRDIRDAIRYRGRDGEDAWSDGKSVALFNTRLCIIDREGGAQPMQDEDGRFVIVFNGAIYNYKELQSDYARQGARFRTRSDTEVILQGFMLKRERILDDLNGMFAFAIWDSHEQRLFLARDRLGKKPLFWCKIGKTFAFASTIDAFRRIDGWTDRLSEAGLTLYSFLGGFPRETTAFAQAHALPPASFAWFAPGDARPRVSRYWLPRYGEKARGRESDFLDEYGELLADAVRLRLRSDVPLALSFSGGTDSGTIAALAKTRFNVSLDCYTIDYDTPADRSEEVVIAREVAQALALAWTHIQYDYRGELLQGLEEAYQYFDQPCQQLALVYSKRLYDVMKRHCTVVLGGNGADELFTGYAADPATARFDQTRRWLRHVPDWLYTKFPGERRSTWQHVRLNRMTIPQWARGDIRAHAALFSAKPEVRDDCARVADQVAEELAEAGVDTMMDCVMHRALIVSAADTNYRLADITGYAAQVEVRSPFLDYRMVEFAARLPHRFKVGVHNSQAWPKFLPRRFYERFVGPKIAWNTKKGMGANLRWDLELVRNPAFIGAISAAYETLDRDGIHVAPFTDAYDQFSRDVARQAPSQPSAGTMMNGFMLGCWIRQKLHSSRPRSQEYPRDAAAS